MNTTAQKLKKIIIAGSQNVGKSSLFNLLTKVQVQVANYPGATVQYQTAQSRPSLGIHAEISDSPGIISLDAHSPEQEIAVRGILDENAKADLYIVMIDASQMTRQLYLVEQMKEANLPVLLCVSMVDRLEDAGRKLDIEALGKAMGVKAVAISNSRRTGFHELVDAIKEFPESDYTIKKHQPANDSEMAKKFQRYSQIEKDVISGEKAKQGFDWDTILLHPVLGLLIFTAVMTGIFTAVFAGASWPMDILESVFGLLSEKAGALLGEGAFSEFVSAVISDGLGAVMVFLPQIIILFLAMTWLEDSGYLARGAMLMDKPLSLIGLNGRSFVPMLSGFACAIPAMISARTITNPLERKLTVFLVPLMTCSARLPVYALLLAFLTPADKPWIGGLALTAMYFIGIIISAIIATIVSRRSDYRARTSGFQLELPSYKKPLLRVLLRTTFHKSWQYVKNAGPTIVVIAIAIWLLANYPNRSHDSNERIAGSYIAQIGHVTEPIVKPMGLDWRSGVSIITSFAAREVFVSTLAQLYHVDSEDEDALTEKMLTRMNEATFEGTSNKVFTPASICGLLFFFAVALQCFPTTVVARNELGSWKTAIVQLALYSVIAYIGAVVIVQGLRAIGIS